MHEIEVPWYSINIIRLKRHNTILKNEMYVVTKRIKTIKSIKLRPSHYSLVEQTQFKFSPLANISSYLPCLVWLAHGNDTEIFATTHNRVRLGCTTPPEMERAYIFARMFDKAHKAKIPVGRPTEQARELFDSYTPRLWSIGTAVTGGS